MTCKVKANPKPTIVWYQAGKVVKESSKVSMSIDQKDDIYSIKLELKVGRFSVSGPLVYHLNIVLSLFLEKIVVTSVSVDIYRILVYEI